MENAAFSMQRGPAHSHCLKTELTRPFVGALRHFLAVISFLFTSVLFMSLPSSSWPLSYRVFIRNCALFQIHWNPSSASSQEIRVCSNSYWLTIFEQPIAAEYWQRRGRRKYRQLLKKTTIFNEQPVA